ncbi:MAG: penicillin-binding protein 2 [Candidatus Saccharimonadales bacterium]
MQSQNIEAHSITRVRIWYGAMILLFGVFALRLFYIQVIRYDHYKQVALSDQVHEYEVVPTRGAIYATTSEGGSVPLVINQRLFTLYADPTVVKDVDAVARSLAPVVGGNEAEIRELIANKKRRYVVLAKRLTKEQSAKIQSFEFAGVGTQENNYRTYPQGTLAAQTLGFVNDEGAGKYGLEQALNSTLGGTTGWLKAVTDVNGVPLAANEDNLSRKPVPGKDVKLTLDIGMQTQLEAILQRAQEKFKSKMVSGVILESQTGAVKAMANYPTYDPASYQTVQDGALFQNGVVANAIEPGSITKVLTTAAALDKGVINAGSTYNDPGVWQIDGAKVLNVAEGKGSGPQSIKSLLDLSLNTGATWELMQLGGGKLNMQGRSTLYDYFVNKYRLSKLTGVEQGYESTGYVPEAEDNGAGINLTFANMSFGQAYNATAMQMGAALSAIVNGGTFYQPRLVDEIISSDGTREKTESKVLGTNVVSEQASKDMVTLLDYVTKSHAKSFKYMNFGDKYIVGGKTGTAQIADNKTRLYREDAFNGTFMGFVGGDTAQYTVVIYNIEPRGYAGYAGAQTGQPVFAEVAHMLIDNYGVEPKTSP